MAAPDKNPQSDLQPGASNPALPDRQPMHQSQFSQGQADRGPTIPGITNPEHSRMRQQMQGLWQQEMRPRQMGRDGVTGGQLTTQFPNNMSNTLSNNLGNDLPNTAQFQLTNRNAAVLTDDQQLRLESLRARLASYTSQQSPQFLANMSNTVSNNLGNDLPNTAQSQLTNRNATRLFEDRQLELLRHYIGPSYLQQQGLQRQLQSTNVQRPTLNDLRERLKMVQASLHDNERRQSEINNARQNGAKHETEYHPETLGMLEREAKGLREIRGGPSGLDADTNLVTEPVPIRTTVPIGMSLWRAPGGGPVWAIVRCTWNYRQ